jgi:hypothetical protein
MQIHEKCANPFNGWIYLAEPDASIRPSCRRRLRCHTRLPVAPNREILGHPARIACQKQNYYEHGDVLSRVGRHGPRIREFDATEHLTALAIECF